MNIAKNGVWSARSGKYKSLNMLFNSSEDYYQSCSPSIPHDLYCQFYVEQFINKIRIRLNLLDETYYPERIIIYGGSRRSLSVLAEWTLTTLFDSWIEIPINQRVFTIGISIIQVKNGGQDIRLSEIQVIK